MSRIPRVLFTVALLFVCLTLAPNAKAVDFDEDGIDDSVESDVLSTFAPAWRPDDPDNDLPPLPLSWYISHCELREYIHPGRLIDYNGTDDRGTFVSTTGNQVLTLETIIPIVKSPLPLHHFYRLAFKSDSFRYGNDPSSPRTYSIAKNLQDCLYGRCTHLEGEKDNYYLLQYYLFFGWNDVDADRNPIGCPIGNHEGDVVCVEFEVEYNSATDHRLVRAIYHDHGRQVFIDEPSALDYSAGHPVVYLEKENHEALPWRGDCGFVDGLVPSCIGITQYFESKDVSIFNVPVAGECDSVPTVRQHNGGGVEVLITSVINLGERGAPGPSAEAQFVHAFNGLYGDSATACCDDPFGSPTCQPVDSPRGPPFQGKMWDREWHGGGATNRNFRDSRFPGCKGSDFLSPRTTTVWVDFNLFGAPAAQVNGGLYYPFSALADAVVAVTAGGKIKLQPGATILPITISKPTTLLAPNGSVTIGE